MAVVEKRFTFVEQKQNDMYTVVDLYDGQIIFIGTLVECARYKPSFNSLLDIAICRNDSEGDIVKIIHYPYN